MTTMTASTQLQLILLTCLFNGTSALIGAETEDRDISSILSAQVTSIRELGSIQIAYKTTVPDKNGTVSWEHQTISRDIYAANGDFFSSINHQGSAKHSDEKSKSRLEQQVSFAKWGARLFHFSQGAVTGGYARYMDTTEAVSTDGNDMNRLVRRPDFFGSLALMNPIDTSTVCTPLGSLCEFWSLYDRHTGGFIANPRWCDALDPWLLREIRKISSLSWSSPSESKRILSVRSLKSEHQATLHYDFIFDQASSTPDGNPFWRLSMIVRSPLWRNQSIQYEVDQDWHTHNREEVRIDYNMAKEIQGAPPLLALLIPSQITVTEIGEVNRVHSISRILEASTCEASDIEDLTQEHMLSSNEIFQIR